MKSMRSFHYSYALALIYKEGQCLFNIDFEIRRLTTSLSSQISHQ